MQALPARAKAYIAVVVLCGLTASVVSALLVVLAPDPDFLGLTVFAVLFGLTSAFATLAGRGVGVSVAFIVGIAAVVVLGPAGGVVVATTGAFMKSRSAHVEWVKRLFNGAMFPLCALASGLTYQLLGGESLAEARFAAVIGPALVAALVFYLVNMLLVGGVVSFTSGMPLSRVWAGSLSWFAIGYLGYGFLGLVIAQIYVEMGPFSTLFSLTPLLVARQAFDNYAQQREAYDSTVRAFAQAVETKDYYTRGHSERVSKVAELIAREHGMREDRVQVIRIAGMLHDVGKLGVPTRVLQKQGKLNQLEFEAIKLHPLRGYEMLCEIEFLHEALDGVYHHHERMDGRGYPMGLAGEEIPEFARIVMVADAFDSMTSTRSYREAKSVDDALAELRRCERVQFDEHMVDCLVRAIAKHGWEAHPESFHGEQVSRDGRPIVLAEPNDRFSGAESDHG